MLKQARRGWCRTFIVVCVSFIFAYQPVAWSASPATVGQIATEGNAEINGLNAVTGGSVFSGDRIITRPDSRASLFLTNGSRLVLLGSSSAQIKTTGNHLMAVLDRGQLAIVSPSTSPLAVEAGGTKIVPGKDGSIYVVALNANRLKVMAQKGTVSVEASNRTVDVAEGKTLNATLDPQQEPEGVGASAIQNRSGPILLVISLGLAGTALALAIVDITAGCKVSPSTVGSCQVTH